MTEKGVPAPSDDLRRCLLGIIQRAITEARSSALRGRRQEAAAILDALDGIACQLASWHAGSLAEILLQVVATYSGQTPCRLVEPVLRGLVGAVVRRKGGVLPDRHVPHDRLGFQEGSSPKTRQPALRETEVPQDSQRLPDEAGGFLPQT